MQNIGYKDKEAVPQLLLALKDSLLFLDLKLYLPFFFSHFLNCWTASKSWKIYNRMVILSLSMPVFVIPAAMIAMPVVLLWVPFSVPYHNPYPCTTGSNNKYHNRGCQSF